MLYLDHITLVMELGQISTTAFVLIFLLASLLPSKYQTRDQSQASPSRLSQQRANTYESMSTSDTTRGDSNVLKLWLERLYFQFDAPNVVKRAYAKTCRPPSKYALDVYLTSNNAAGSPFTVKGMGDSILLVPSSERIRDISPAPRGQLSFHPFRETVCSFLYNQQDSLQER